jgi:putative inorganic carbon (hco3(-)) transporter
VTIPRPLALTGVFALALAITLVAGAMHLPPALVEHGASVYVRLMLFTFAGAIAYLVWMIPPWVTITAGVVLSPLASNWKLLGVPGGMSPDRLLLVGAIAVVLLRGPGARGVPALRLRPTHALLGLLLLYAIVSAASVGTLFDQAGFFRLFDAFGVLPFVVFFLAPAVFCTVRSRALLLAALVALGAYLGLTALFEAANLDALVFPHFIVSSTATDTSGRAYGPFLEPVSNGAGLFDCGVAAAVAFVTWRRASARAFAALTATVCAAGTFFTLERSVWIGAIVAVAVTVAIGIPRLGRRGRGLGATLVLVAAAATVAGSALLFVPGLSHTVYKRATDQGTVYDRKNLTTAAENMIATRPLFGFGWSSFERRSLEYFQQSPDAPLNPNLAYSPTTKGTYSVHNAFLDYSVTLGLVGAALWVLGLVLAAGGAVRARSDPDDDPDLARWRFALLPLLAFYLVIENAVPPALFPNLALWLWLGIVWTGYSGRGNAAVELTPESSARPRRRHRACV